MVGCNSLEVVILVRVQIRQLSCESDRDTLFCNVFGIPQNHCRVSGTGTRPVNRTACSQDVYSERWHTR